MTNVTKRITFVTQKQVDVNVHPTQQVEIVVIVPLVLMDWTLSKVARPVNVTSKGRLTISVTIKRVIVFVWKVSKGKIVPSVDSVITDSQIVVNVIVTHQEP